MEIDMAREGDRWTRRRMGNPVTKAIIERVAGEKFVEYYEEPYLTIEGGYVADFQYIGTNPVHHRRFVIIKVTNEGLHSAEDCWAHINIPELGLEKIPLHWADESYDIRRNSMDMITIPPGVSRDLDVAFSVYGEEYDEGKTVSTRDNSVSVTVSVNPSVETLVTGYGSTISRGTYDPRLATTGARLYEEIPKQPDPKLKGSWLASHLVLAIPIENSEHYLPPDSPPKRYDCTIEVICGNGKGDETSITIMSSIEPSGLMFDYRITPPVTRAHRGSSS